MTSTQAGDNSQRPDMAHRRPSMALSTLRERLHSGPRISPPLTIGVPAKSNNELGPPIFVQSFSPVSPTTFGRIGLTLLPDGENKGHGKAFGGDGAYATSLHAQINARRGSGASTTSSSSNGSSPVDSSPTSSFLSLASLEQSAGGPRTPSYLGLSPRSSVRDLPPSSDDPVIDHLRSDQIAARRVTFQSHRPSISSRRSTGHEDMIGNASDLPSTLINVERPSPKTQLNAAALAKLELENKADIHIATTAEDTQPGAPIFSNDNPFYSHLSTRLRPK